MVQGLVACKPNLGYKGPSYDAVRTALLDNAKQRVNGKLRAWEVHGKTVTGFVMMADGWRDAQGRPLLNFVLYTPKGVKFLQAVDTSGEEKNADYLAEVLGQMLEEIGVEHVHLIIQDAAAANVAASRLLEER